METKQRTRLRGRIVILTAVMTLALGGAAASRLGAESGPRGASAALLRRWNDVGRKLIDIAEDLPEAKYDYRPHPDARTFVDQLLHAAGAMASFADRVGGRAERFPCDPTRATVQTRGELIELVRQSVVAGDAILRAAGETGLDRRIDDGSVHGARLADFADVVIEHSGEHYGQLVVYYRINGLVPPESR